MVRTNERETLEGVRALLSQGMGGAAVTQTAAADYAIIYTLQGLEQKREALHRRDTQTVEDERLGRIIRSVLRELHNAGLLNTEGK